MAKPNRSAQGIENRRASSRRYAKEHRKERIAYNKNRLEDNPSLAPMYRRRRLDRLKEEFENGIRSRATEKKCPLCTMTKDASQFYMSNFNPDGLHGWCKECSDRKTVENGRKRLFGVTPAMYEDIFEGQNRACAICRTTDSGKKDFAVDHDHKTGAVRGILCHRCNILLGSICDDVEILKQATSYLSGRKQ